MAQASKRRRKKRKLTDAEKITEAFKHLVRVNAWLLIYQQPSSPNRISEILNEPLANVAYHVRVLEECECIELAELNQRRGAVEHVYRAVQRLAIRSVKHWEEIPPAERRHISLLGVQWIFGECVAAQNADTFDARIDRHLSRIPMELDDKGWQLAGEALNALRDRLMEIDADCATRVADDPEIPTFPALGGLLMFQRAPVPSSG